MLSAETVKAAVKGKSVSLSPKVTFRQIESDPTLSEVLNELVLVFCAFSPVQSAGVAGKVNARRAMATLIKQGFSPREIREAIESAGFEVSPWKIRPRKEISGEPTSPVYGKLEE